MPKFFSFITICAILIAMVSCEKGEPGPPGNANVYTQKFIVLPGQWSHFGTTGLPDEGFSIAIPTSIITPDIVNSGVVMAYFSNDGNNWNALPFTYPTGTGSTVNYSESWNFYYSVNLITIDIQDSDFLTEPPQGNCYFKIVAIDGAIVKSHPAVDWNNYNEVKAEFQLTE